MAERHKWADVIIAMANGEVAEYQRPEGGVWFRSDINDTNPFTDAGCEWRIKPRTIMIGDMEVPEPLRSMPDKDTIYFIADAAHEDLCYEEIWDGVAFDYRHFERGLCHATRDAALLHAKALIEVSGGEV